jgi:hypothetical protein
MEGMVEYATWNYTPTILCPSGTFFTASAMAAFVQSMPPSESFSK